MVSLYKSTAADTEEGKKRQTDYWTALGCFIDMYAKAEINITFALWFYSGLRHKIARAAFVGTSMERAIDVINNIVVVSDLPENIRTDLKDLFGQLGVIQRVRNDILHFGATNVPEGSAGVSNALKALTEAKVSIFPISPALLDDMTADHRKINASLLLRHMGRPAISAASLKLLDHILSPHGVTSTS